MNNYFKLVSAAVVMTVISVGAVYADDMVKSKEVKAMSCKQQAKKIKDKKERNAAMKECKSKKAEKTK